MEASTRPPAPQRGPIFIVAAMGSGTTLLRLMLDSHESIALPHETGFMRAYNAMQFIPFKWTGRGWAARLGWSQEEFDEKLRQFFDDIFMRYAEQHGKQRWGEKTPLHTWHIGAMKRLFPDSVFIAIVRHPGAAVTSNTRRFHHPLKKATHHYLRYNKEIARHAGMHPKRMIVMRYEDLLLRTEPVMRELLDWLGEPWSDSVLQHHVIQGERDHVRIEGKTKADESIDASRVARWATTVSDSDRKYMSKRLDRIGEFFGYSMDDPATLAPLSDTGSLLFGGPEVKRRIERFPDLDIPTRMPVPIYEHYYHPGKFLMVDVESANERFPTASGEQRFFGPAAVAAAKAKEAGAPEPKPKPPPSVARRAARRVVRSLPAPARRQLLKARRR